MPNLSKTMTFASALAATCILAAPAFAVDPSRSFVDNFDRFDTKRWYVSDGWSNGKHQNCVWSKNLLNLKDGVLTLGFRKQKIKDREYACAEIQTHEPFGYGTYEARIKTGKGSGLNAAFFTYIGPHHKKPHDEIDFEVLLKDPSKVQLNVYANGKGGNEKLVPVAGGTDKGFNDYAFVWKEDRVDWYVNGELVYTVSDPAKLPTNDQRILFSVWGSDNMTDWLGGFADPGESAFLEIDRVAFTALGAPCQFEGSVACD
jgi:endo-1,3-1,4-beta-glycanase ExoK